MEPYCKDLHLTMAKIESLELNVDIDGWENVLLLAIRQFSNDLDLWKTLIEFYIETSQLIEKKRPNFNLNAKLADIYHQANAAISHDELLAVKWKQELEEFIGSFIN